MATKPNNSYPTLHEKSFPTLHFIVLFFYFILFFFHFIVLDPYGKDTLPTLLINLWTCTILLTLPTLLESKQTM